MKESKEKEMKINLDHGVDVAFRSGEFGRIFDPDENDKVEVVPHVVLVPDVVLKTNSLVIELRTVQSASETRVFQNLLFLLFLAPQVGERVDDDTKDQIQHDNDHHEEEDHVVDHSRSEHRLLLNHFILIQFNIKSKPSRSNHSKINDQIFDLLVFSSIQ